MRIKPFFYIRERWNMGGDIEKYNEDNCPANTIKASSKKSALNKVKKWINDWIETWKFNAKDNDYKFISSETDYETFARCRIKREDSTDYFSLRVVKV